MSVLFRNLGDVEEYDIAKEVLGDNLFEHRSDIPSNSLVIGRYSVLPFYNELDKELRKRNSYLVNSYDEHLYIANMEWYEDIKHLTPRTWFNCGYKNVPEAEHGWVVKGLTNSRKFQWNSMMYAPDRESLKNVMNRLMDDSLIGQQGLVIREYEPLYQLDESINGLPFTQEYRIFFYRNQIISFGFYWANYENAEMMDGLGLPGDALDIAIKASEIISQHTNFYVIDVGKKENGEYTVIEVNDGQMSGLSMASPWDFYNELLNKSYENYKPAGE